MNESSAGIAQKLQERRGNSERPACAVVLEFGPLASSLARIPLPAPTERQNPHPLLSIQFQHIEAAVAGTLGVLEDCSFDVLRTRPVGPGLLVNGANVLVASQNDV